MEPRDSEPAMPDTYTFVLVHGGCHDGSAWRPVIETRNQRGEVVQTTTVKLLVPRRSKTDGTRHTTEGN